ncbi:hypothetical protein [Streptomyces caeruleatus]|uniref:Uncharacterized protein n=1 Tax=Streptomyces caeruleatus TaxID=661399 RepID=A0A101TED6_9ACTN|nr:hypothetical protein [Streptomyces caeruleatus]KUN90903.1 hypothetical protein AQJ67_43390 [Streptomyces caeruleatus]
MDEAYATEQWVDLHAEFDTFADYVPDFVLQILRQGFQRAEPQHPPQGDRFEKLGIDMWTEVVGSMFLGHPVDEDATLLQSPAHCFRTGHGNRLVEQWGIDERLIQYFLLKRA